MQAAGAAEAAGESGEEQLVVADQASEQAETAGVADKGERQSGLSRSRLTGDQDPTVAEHDGAGMDIVGHQGSRASRRPEA